MEEFNSDERFLVPDSEDEDLNSREPWDLVSGLEALASQKGFIHRQFQVMSSPNKKRGVFAIFDSSEGAGESHVKKTALAYDTVSSDVDSGDSRNQTVIERKVPSEKNLMDKETSTPSQVVGSLHFSQDFILVPETLDSVVDDAGQQSPTILHTAPFIVPDSPSQGEDDDNVDEKQQDEEISFKPIPSTLNSQSSMKIDSQGLHLHLSQSQLESSENADSVEQVEAVTGDKDVFTTPIKDPTISLSCRKLSLKDAPPSPKLGDYLPRPSFHLPSKLHLPSASEDEEVAESLRSEKLTAGTTERPLHAQEESSRSTWKQQKKLRLFLDTEEDAKVVKDKEKRMLSKDKSQELRDRDVQGETSDRNLKEREDQPQIEASLVLTEEPESMMAEDDHTMSYEYNRSLENSRYKESTLVDETQEHARHSTSKVKNKEDSQSQEAEFDGFEEEVEAIAENVSLQSNLKGVTDENSNRHEKSSSSHIANEAKDDSPNAPSSQVKLTEFTEMDVEGTSKDLAEGNPSINYAISEVSALTESQCPDPYHFQASQSQNIADVSNQPLTDKSKSVDKSGSKTKVVKVMRKVLKKKTPLKKIPMSSSGDELGSHKPVKTSSLRRKTSAVKLGSKKTKSNVVTDSESTNATSNRKQDMQSTEVFTALQSRSSDVSIVGAPLSQFSTVSNVVSSEMPPPMTRGDLSRRGAHTVNETSPMEVNRLNKKTTTVSFQDDFLPKVKSTAKEVSEYTNGEVERKTVREFKAIVVERETTIEILDDKGNILKQTVTKEVIRTPVEPPWMAVNVHVTEKTLSPNVSPSRSVSTLSSGDLADVSSSSLSRSISSGSKGSNPSLEFCSQSYPTAAQRSHPIESGGDETNVLGKAPSTMTAPSSVLAKRLSSGSNTGQDLFESPDASLIPLCYGSHFDKPPSSSNSTPVNVNNQIVMSSVGVEAQEKAIVPEMDRGEEDNEPDENRLQMQLDENTGENTTVKAMGRVRSLRGNSNRKKQEVVEEVSSASKGKGKRRMEEKSDQENPLPGKRTKQDEDKEVQQEGEVERMEVSGSSMSIGFAVQGIFPSYQGSPLDKATSSKSKESSSQQAPVQEAVNTVVDSTLVVEIKSRLVIGEQVMGKWTDGFYYPGVLKKLGSVNQRYYLKFDDGTQRWVGPDGLLLAKELPIGQSVMVMREDGYYECGMIMAHSWTPSDKQDIEKVLMYHVERDDGITQKCTRKCLLLSEDQAACLISDQNMSLPHDILPTAATKIGDISLDNLVEGKRQHRGKCEKSGEGDAVTSGKKSVKATSEEETPVVSHEAGARSGRKRKIGPVATSTPTPKLITKAAQDAVTPVKTSVTDTLGGVVSSPSVSRKAPRKTRQGLFIQKLKPVPDLFKGLTFLLTNIEKSAEQRQEEKCILDEAHPFIKEQLHSLILAGGGKVLDKYDVEEIQKTGVSQCYLVASEYQRTIKYLQALAGNLTIVSHQWILHSIDQGRLLGLKAFLLPAGISLEKKKVMECRRVCTSLIGQTMLIVSNRNEFVEAWASILSLAKCHVTTRFPARASKTDPGIDFVVSDTTCSATIVRKCRNLDVPLVSSEWIAQCLINNCMVDPNSHEKYIHDYGA